MDNNNNKRSPLDEIKRVTREASGQRPTGPKPMPTQRPTPAAQPVQRPAAAPTHAAQPAQRPAAAPTRAAQPAQSTVRPTAPQPKPDHGIDVPNIQRPSATDNMSRADKVRIARENAMRAREQNQETRVMNVTEMSPDQLAKMESEREEARRLVQQNQGKNNRYATRVTSTVKPVAPKPKAVKEKEPTDFSEEFEEAVGRGVLSNTIKAVIYIVSVLVVSGCLALFAIFVGNDCFAFVKSDTEVTVTIPEDADLGDIAKELKRNDVIEYPSMFKLYITIRNKDSGNYIAGEHTVSPMMGYDSLIAAFKPSVGREEITLTIVEGSTTQEIIDLFVSNGIGTQEGFEAAIESYEFDFWFIKELDEIDTSDRIYRLDGYLFPDTYNFFTDCTEAEALYKLLSNFNAKFDEENKARCEELGMTVDDIVTMASIIQKEAMYVVDYPLVSSAFHNRIKSGMKLESNATVQYTMPKEEVELELSYDQITTYDNGYNTYLYKGLPAGPICNSSLNALNWAMYPSDTDYIYFVSDDDGYNHYAVTYNEHLKNVAEYQGD